MSLSSAARSFLADTQTVHSAILQSTELGFSGTAYYLELFIDGSYRLSDQCNSSSVLNGLSVLIPRLEDDEYDHGLDGDHYFENLRAELTRKIHQVLADLIQPEKSAGSN
jgi:hypothetical protein